MNPKLQDFMKVWQEVEKFAAPEHRPIVALKDDYCPYGTTGVREQAYIFNDKYAAFISLKEWDSGSATEVVRIEQIKPEDWLIEKYEPRGMDPALIYEPVEGWYYSAAFFLLDAIMGDFQDKLKAEGKN